MPARPPYSTRLYTLGFSFQDVDTTITQGINVAGFTAVVRDIDARIVPGSTESVVDIGLVSDAGLVTLLNTGDFPAGQDEFPWRGRQVVLQAERLQISVSGGSVTMSVAISGYLLTGLSPEP
jgi:hypothetical protein